MIKNNQQKLNRERIVFDKEKQFFFPEGVPGFRSVRNFVIAANEQETPFIWLQGVTPRSFAFITIDPFLIESNYVPEIEERDLNQLEISDPEETFILSVVTIHPEQKKMTANLVSPILINRKKRKGKQIILKNHRDYSIYYKII